MQCCLLELMNHEPPERSRARRWARCLTGEVQYCAGWESVHILSIILLTVWRQRVHVPFEGCELLLQPNSVGWACSGLSWWPCSSGTLWSLDWCCNPLPAEATWPEICRRYLLSTRSGKVPAGSGAWSEFIAV